jgi:hypothetical protein
MLRDLTIGVIATLITFILWALFSYSMHAGKIHDKQERYAHPSCSAWKYDKDLKIMLFDPLCYDKDRDGPLPEDTNGSSTTR